MAPAAPKESPPDTSWLAAAIQWRRIACKQMANLHLAGAPIVVVVGGGVFKPSGVIGQPPTSSRRRVVPISGRAHLNIAQLIRAPARTYYAGSSAAAAAFNPRPDRRPAAARRSSRQRRRQPETVPRAVSSRRVCEPPAGLVKREFVFN